MLTDPQDNGDYFSYWDDEIIGMIEEGLERSSEIGTNIFSYGSYAISASFQEHYHNVLIESTKKAYDGYMRSQRIGETPEETEWFETSGRADMKAAKYEIRKWIVYWEENKETIKEAYDWE